MSHSVFFMDEAPTWMLLLRLPRPISTLSTGHLVAAFLGAACTLSQSHSVEEQALGDHIDSQGASANTQYRTAEQSLTSLQHAPWPV